MSLVYCKLIVAWVQVGLIIKKLNVTCGSNRCLYLIKYFKVRERDFIHMLCCSANETDVVLFVRKVDNFLGPLNSVVLLNHH